MSRRAVEFEDFHILHTPLLHMKPQRRPHDMKTLYAGCSRIDYEHIALEVIDHLEDMGMSAHEDVGTVLVDESPCTRVISPRISADMGHEHLCSGTLKQLVLRIFKPYVISVAIPVNGFQRLECGNGFCRGKIAEIAGMPYLVNGSKKIPEWSVEDAVCV